MRFKKNRGKNLATAAVIGTVALLGGTGVAAATSSTPPAGTGTTSVQASNIPGGDPAAPGDVQDQPGGDAEVADGPNDGETADGPNDGEVADGPNDGKTADGPQDTDNVQQGDQNGPEVPDAPTGG